MCAKLVLEERLGRQMQQRRIPQVQRRQDDWFLLGTAVQPSQHHGRPNSVREAGRGIANQLLQRLGRERGPRLRQDFDRLPANRIDRRRHQTCQRSLHRGIDAIGQIETSLGRAIVVLARRDVPRGPGEIHVLAVRVGRLRALPGQANILARHGPLPVMAHRVTGVIVQRGDARLSIVEGHRFQKRVDQPVRQFLVDRVLA